MIDQSINRRTRKWKHKRKQKDENKHGTIEHGCFRCRSCSSCSAAINVATTVRTVVKTAAAAEAAAAAPEAAAASVFEWEIIFNSIEIVLHFGRWVLHGDVVQQTQVHKQLIHQGNQDWEPPRVSSMRHTHCEKHTHTHTRTHTLTHTHTHTQAKQTNKERNKQNKTNKQTNKQNEANDTPFKKKVRPEISKKTLVEKEFNGVWLYGDDGVITSSKKFSTKTPAKTPKTVTIPS